MAEVETPAPAGIDLKQAVEAARDSLNVLVKDGLVPGPIANVAVEGFLRNVSGQWVITLGYRVPTPIDAVGGLLSQMRPPRPDFYKDFTVDHHTGKVIAMGAREPRPD